MQQLREPKSSEQNRWRLTLNVDNVLIDIKRHVSVTVLKPLNEYGSDKNAYCLFLRPSKVININRSRRPYL
jgi:hypothetical protein